MISVRDRMCLDLASQHWKYAGAYETAVRQQVGMSLPVFARHLSHLIRRPEVEAELPTLVRRLRRLEGARRSQRRGSVFTSVV